MKTIHKRLKEAAGTAVTVGGQVLDFSASIASPLGTGLAGKVVIEATRGREDNDTIKNMTAVANSINDVGVSVKTNVDLFKVLFQVWPHLTKGERVGVSLMIILADAALGYAMDRFGVEQNILAACYATTAGVACLKLVENFLLFKYQQHQKNEENAKRFEIVGDEEAPRYT